MTKIQKIWIWIFLAMFAIPEILWSPVLNFLYIFYKGGNVPIILRNNFLINSDYKLLAILIIFLQSMGALISSILILKSNVKFLSKIILFLTFFVLFILSFFVLILLLMTFNMRIF